MANYSDCTGTKKGSRTKSPGLLPAKTQSVKCQSVGLLLVYMKRWKTETYERIKILAREKKELESGL